MNSWRHYIEISPDVKYDGTRCWYAAAHEGPGVETPIITDGSGSSIEFALCNLIDNLAERYRTLVEEGGVFPPYGSN